MVWCVTKSNGETYRFHGAFDPRSVPTDATRLYLDNVDFDPIPAGVFANLTQLHLLSFVSENITRIEPRAFEGLESLESLSFYSQRYYWSGFADLEPQIEGETMVLETRVFRGLNNITSIQIVDQNLDSLSLQPDIWSDIGDTLTHLKLTTNKISSLSADMFDVFSSLETLDVGQNLIQYLPTTLFSSLISLQELRLHNNRIQHIELDAFKGLSLLNQLFLNNNNISTLDAGLFSGLFLLRILDLSRNEIQSIPLTLFSDLSSLQDLRLNNNKIQSVQPGVLSSLNSLTTLWLNFNSIQNIEPGLLSGLTSLRWLFLDNNELTTLAWKIFNPQDFAEHGGHPGKLMILYDRSRTKNPNYRLTSYLC